MNSISHGTLIVRSVTDAEAQQAMANKLRSEHFGVDIICCRIAVAKDSVTNSEYLVCSHVYPSPELAKEAASRGRKHGSTKVKWPDWETAMSGVTNNTVISYFKKEFSASLESYLRKRILRYRADDKRRWCEPIY